MISFVESNNTRIEGLEKSVSRIQKLTARNHSELDCRITELSKSTSDWYSSLYRIHIRQDREIETLKHELLRLYMIMLVLACVVVLLTLIVALMVFGVF